jgi:hypothetical protein
MPSVCRSCSAGCERSFRSRTPASLRTSAPCGDRETVSLGSADQLLERHLGIVRVLAEDRSPGRPVHPAEAFQAMTDQDPVHGRCGDTDDARQARRADLAGLAQRHDVPLEPRRDLIRAAVWPTRMIFEPSDAFVAAAAPRLVRAPTGHVHRLGSVVLLCPMLDDRMTTVSARQRADGVPWTGASNATGWRMLLGDRAGGPDVSPDAAPGRAHRPHRPAALPPCRPAALPPTYKDVGSADVSHDEDVAFASTVWACGGKAELHLWSGGYHAYERFAHDAHISIDTVAARRRWLTPHLLKAGAIMRRRHARSATATIAATPTGRTARPPPAEPKRRGAVRDRLGRRQQP